MSPITQLIILKSLMVAGAGIEYLLGKTKAGSGIGLVINTVGAAATALKNNSVIAAPSTNVKDSNMNDISELKALVQFGFSMYNAGKDIFGNGKFDASKLGDLVAVYEAAVPAFQNISQALPEFESLNDAEIAELTAMFAAQGIANQEIAVVIGKSLEIAGNVYSLIKIIKG